jgi:hypothetical protein
MFYLYINIILMFTIPKCLQYKIKWRKHNSQTQQLRILKLYIIMLERHVLTSIQLPSDPQKTIQIQTYKYLSHCGIPNAHIVRSIHYNMYSVNSILFMLYILQCILLTMWALRIYNYNVYSLVCEHWGYIIIYTNTLEYIQCKQYTVYTVRILMYTPYCVSTRDPTVW